MVQFAKCKIDSGRKKKEAFKNWKGDYKKGKSFTNLFKSIKNVLEQAGKSCDNYALNEFAYYNYFLRPALKKCNNSLEKHFKEIDIKIANKALLGIIQKLNPDLVIITSTLVYNNCKEHLTKKTHFRVNNPSNKFGCWTKNENNGSKKFENALKEYWLK